MSFSCELCGKKPMTGGHESRTGTRGFLKHRSKRWFRPNLRWFSFQNPQGETVRVRICMKCLKTLKKKQKELQVLESAVKEVSQSK